MNERGKSKNAYNQHHLAENVDAPEDSRFAYESLRVIERHWLSVGVSGILSKNCDALAATYFVL